MSKTIGVILVLLLAAGAIAYIVSDPFRTRVDQAYENFADWTPQNIAKDPAGYLKFCEAKTRQALVDLETAGIAIEQHRSRLLSWHKEAIEKILMGEAELEALKALFKEAEAGGQWPVAYRDQTRDKDWTQRQIIAFHGQIEAQRRILQKAEEALARLGTQEKRIGLARNQAHGQITEIQANQQIVAIDKLTDEVTGRLVQMKEQVQNAVHVAERSTETISLEDLIQETEVKIDPTAFEKIMEGE